MIRLVGTLLLGLFVAVPVLAQPDPSIPMELNPAEAADILARRKAQADRTRPPSPVTTVKDISAGTREEMEKWGALGAGVGKAVISAAKELGMAANEFAETGLGKFVIFVLIMKMFWKTLVGLAFAFVSGWVGFRLAYRLVWPRPSAIEYAHVPILWGLTSIRRITKVENIGYTGDDQAGRFFFAAFISLCTLGLIAIGLFAP